MLHLDIGIDMGGCMQPILFKGQTLPYDYELKVSPMIEQKELEISFYEGQRALVKDNRLLGKILLKHDTHIGAFCLNIHVSELEMKVSIEGAIIETFECSNESTAFFILKESEPFIESDNLIREKERERQNFKEYIYQTLYTLKQIDDKYDKTIILKLLNDAEEVAYMDISIEDIRMAQQETEHNVNFFMSTVVKNGYV